MRQAARSIVLVVLVLFAAVVLAVSYTVTAAVTLTAKAIIVPGTGTPVAGEEYKENFRDYYMGDTFCDPETECQGEAGLVGIDYPASFWPLVIFPTWCAPDRCERWNVSVADGVTGLNAELINTWANNPDEQIVIAGYSQGGQVVANELRNLTGLTDEQKDRIQVVLIGNIANPDGGLWPRLSPLNVFAELLLDATLGPPMITDSGIAVTNVGFEYDPVVYSPLYWGNPFAVLNALVGFDTIHGQYLAGPNRPEYGDLPYGYTHEEVTALVDNGIANCGEPGSNCRLDDYGNKYIMIPATSLPLADAIRGVGASVGLSPIIDPLVDLFEPVVRVLVDLGYDWSGDPGVARPLSILPFNPFQNWLQVGLDLIAAVQEGVDAFLGNVSGSTAPASTDPPEELATLAAGTLTRDTDRRAAKPETPPQQTNVVTTREESIDPPTLESVNDDVAEQRMHRVSARPLDGTDDKAGTPKLIIDDDEKPVSDPADSVGDAAAGAGKNKPEQSPVPGLDDPKTTDTSVAEATPEGNDVPDDSVSDAGEAAA